MSTPTMDPIATAVHAVRRAVTLQEAVLGIHDALVKTMAVKGVKVIRFGDAFSIIEGTSDPTSFYSPGTKIAYGMTEDMTAFLSSMVRGESTILRPGSVDLGLAGIPMAAEGIRAVLGVPLMEEGVVLGALAVGALHEDTFTEHDVVTVERIRDAVGGSLLTLADT